MSAHSRLHARLRPQEAGDDPELLEVIAYNEDNRSNGAIIIVYTGPEGNITTLIADSIDDLNGVLRDARITTNTKYAFLHDFVDCAETVACIKAQSPRQ